MDLSRRRFMTRAAQTAGAIGLFSTAIPRTWARSKEESSYRGAVPVLQGLTTKTTTELIVLIEAKKFLGYQIVSSSGALLPNKITRRETRPYSNWGIEKLFVSELNLTDTYVLKVIDPTSGKTIDERQFKALDTDKSDSKIIVASCMKDTMSSLREKMWDHVNQVRPDLIFLIGDTCYADNDNDGSDEGYWRRYCETRQLLSHFRQKVLIPTLAVWDDHDFGGNNFDSTWVKKDMTKQLFEIFWRNEVESPLVKKGPGISQIFTGFGQQFAMMDDRTFRSPRTEKDYPVQWGSKQESFLFEHLEQNRSPLMLMNGSQFFGGYLKKDAFEYWQKQNLDDICKQLSQVESPVIFVGGDVHFSEFMNLEADILGYPTIEITSSSIHSTTVPFNHLRKKNKRRIDATSSHNFVVIQSNSNPKEWSLKADCISKGMDLEMSETFVIKR